jgi:hypothetical protein
MMALLWVVKFVVYCALVLQPREAERPTTRTHTTTNYLLHRLVIKFHIPAIGPVLLAAELQSTTIHNGQMVSSTLWYAHS